jgi:hypothetical protein
MTGRRTHLPVLAAVALAMAVSALRPVPATAFSGFGTMSADATYGVEMTFEVALPGGAPDRLELLLRFSGADDTFVVPVSASGSSASYRWDAADNGITPNTSVAYRWRATNDGAVTLSREQTLLYDDDRPGLNWRSARFGDATVHWYGGAEATARAFGELSSDAAARAEDLLGHQLAGPIDIFVYATREDFFGALGSGAREWTGAATYPWLRTVFMWLGAGSDSYQRTTLAHEVTHVVFHDATDNPFHEPATWFNEGLATWAEQQSAASERSTVQSATSSGLLSFDAITETFPISDFGARLSYAQGATMIDLIIERYGTNAIAAIAAAWRDGAGDDEALQAGTGVSTQDLYTAYFDSFGVDVPQPVEPAPILPSNVDLPPQPQFSGEPQPSAGSQAATASAAPSGAPSDANGGGSAALIALVVVAGVAAGGFFAMYRAGRRRAGGA